ncbi:MAG TPA: fumarylacetoacetase [Saprospiraceae bacterium]|nr:fumarylacetoacetase [Saprospiraceae bacterium]
MIIDKERKSWIEAAPSSDFPIQNIPFGIGQIDGKTRAVSRIGDTVILLDVLHEKGLFKDAKAEMFESPHLNDFIAGGKRFTGAVRGAIADFADEKNKESYQAWSAQALKPVENVDMLMPVQVGDYTDFYSSREHATNVGTMFRDPENALLPNWLHLPVGYHGRASSIVVSGTDIRRPRGQFLPKDADQPQFGPCKLLDFELEMGFIVGKDTELGSSIPVDHAEEYIFGMVLFNDWSARDIQKWEYVPLGPFLAKSFASTISPWIVTLEALEPFRVPSPEQDPTPLPYLRQSDRSSFDLDLEAFIQIPNGDEKKICHSNFKYMYWTQAQQLAHHTINGCNFRVGDMCASGTISGKTEDSYGSMLELSWRGTKPISMPDGSERKFLNDGDNLILRGYGEKDGLRIGFGEASGKILPAL